MPRIQHANTLVSFPSPATEFSKLSSEACIMLLGSSNPVCEVQNATRCEMQFYGYDARDTLSGGTRNAARNMCLHIFFPRLFAHVRCTANFASASSVLVGIEFEVLFRPVL